MQHQNTNQKIIITCNRKINTHLEKEIIALGYTPIRVFQTGIEIMGDLNDCIKLNLNLRCAGQVLLSLASFDCLNADNLYHGVHKIDWTTIITPETYFSVTSVVFNDTINNNMFANVVVKDAIVDCFMDKINRRPDTGPLKDSAVIHLHWHEDIAEIFIDTSGTTLSKHGYRKISGLAPMIESLASATIIASEWNGTTHFINPMCGSGTLAIEACLVATNRAPGLFRNNYGFMHILNYDERIYLKEMEHMRAMIKPMPNIKIIASDISKKAIEISQQNAEAAGVNEYIEFEVCDFKSTSIPEYEPGIVMINPEYGERLGEIEELEHVYKTIGDFFKQKCKGYTGFIFTGNLDLAKKIGLRASRKIEFFNGKIECRLLKFELYGGTKRVFEDQTQK
jgi:putative N6-adenine-specific DNA methylase